MRGSAKVQDYLFAFLVFIIQFSVLFSRQRYVLGDNAMLAMARSDVFISGMGGLGVEIGEGLCEDCVIVCLFTCQCLCALFA